jgi:hypothetical protein
MYVDGAAAYKTKQNKTNKAVAVAIRGKLELISRQVGA